MSQPTHILVIEDDPSVARGLCAGLEREGYAVTWKANGDEGTSFARDHKPHLIILDVRLPDGSGFDVCRGMRRLGLRQPIMMLTVQRDEVDKILGLEMGADDYLTKPFSPRELRARVRALLRRASGELSAAQADPFHVVHLAENLLFANDQAVEAGGDAEDVGHGFPVGVFVEGVTELGFRHAVPLFQKVAHLFEDRPGRFVGSGVDFHAVARAENHDPSVGKAFLQFVQCGGDGALGKGEALAQSDGTGVVAYPGDGDGHEGLPYKL